MSRIYFGLLVLIFGLQSCTSMQQASGEPVSAESLIYQITGNELAGTSYLVATVPVQDSLFYHYPDKVWTYLEKSDVFISFDDETENETKTLRNQSFAEFNKDYAILPAAYFKSIASNQFKPIVTINPKYSFQNLPQKGSSKAIAKQEFIDDFHSGLIHDLVDFRLSADVNSDQFETLQTKNNYQIIDELITHMKLQPVFFPVDVVYLSGNNGLLNLLRARGYQVKPMQERFYVTNAKGIQQRKALLAQPTLPTSNGTQPVQSNQPVATGNQQKATEYTMPTQPLPLNLPIGIINLDKWGNYVLADSLVVYKAPNRLKQVNEMQQLYNTTSNELEYSIQLENKFKNFDAAIERLIISNGGQMVNVSQVQRFAYPAIEVELIYAENQISKHLVVQHPMQSVIASVKGPTPQIFSQEATTFFQNLQVKEVLMASNQIPVGENGVVTANDQVQTNLPVWQVVNHYDLSVFMPKEPIKIDTLLANGNALSGLLIPRGEVDNNMYLLTSTPVQSFDNFKLFNESINEAASAARAVIVDRTVMPSDKTYYASYMLRDAIENHYRVVYWYGNGLFYQFVIRGDKNSVKNETANQILNSVSAKFIPQPIQ